MTDNVAGTTQQASKRNTDERSSQERDWKKSHDRYGEKVLSLLKEGEIWLSHFHKKQITRTKAVEIEARQTRAKEH